MKVMLLTVTGGSGDWTISTWRRIVSVEDETQFLATMRLVALQELQLFLETLPDTLPNGIVSRPKDEIAQELMKSLKLRLTDLGLTEYPETPEEQAQLYAKVLTGEPT